MRSAIWVLIVVLCLGGVIGCTGGKGPTAEDTAFEKQLADAAAANKNPPKTKNGKMAPKDKPANPPAGGSPATSGS